MHFMDFLWWGVLFCALFTCIFIVLCRVLSDYIKDKGANLHVANQIISGVHASIAFCVGVYICKRTEHDVLYAREPLATLYPCMATGYGVYDTFCMYYVYARRKNMQLGLDSLKKFVGDRYLIVVHHLVLLFCFFPIVMWFRKGKGDFYVGAFLLAEGSTPFVVARAVLSEVGLKRSLLYTVNGILMLVMFFCCRVLLFPFMFSRYANYAGIPLYMVPFRLPYTCITGCTFVFSLQVYWFCLMLNGAKKILVDKEFDGVDEAYTNTTGVSLLKHQ